MTYGCIVYQEQVMQIFAYLGGIFFGSCRYCAPRHVEKESRCDGTETQIFIYGLTAEDGTVEVEGCVRALRKALQKPFSMRWKALLPTLSIIHAAAYAALSLSDCLAEMPLSTGIYGCFAD